MNLERFGRKESTIVTQVLPDKIGEMFEGSEDARRKIYILNPMGCIQHFRGSWEQPQTPNPNPKLLSDGNGRGTSADAPWRVIN